MRGNIPQSPSVFAYFNIEDRIPDNHPLRRVKAIADQVLTSLDRDFSAMYSEVGRPSIPPEVLLKSQLLMALYTVRSDRLFCEKLFTDLLFRWFLDLELDGQSFDHSVFSKNRERLLDQGIAQKFFDRVVQYAKAKQLLSDEHFTVDGTLIESLASLKSFKPKDADQKPDSDDDSGNPTVDFHGEKRSNQTHESTTDPESRLFRKGSGKEAKLCFMGNAIMENRNGLCIGFRLDEANGTSEREGAKKLVRYIKRKGFDPKSIGADKNYHTKAFVAFCRAINIKPHIAQRATWHIPGLDNRTTRHVGYLISQRKRKLIEEIFGWVKTTGGLAKSRLCGRAKTEDLALLAFSALNLLRIAKLTAQPA